MPGRFASWLNRPGDFSEAQSLVTDLGGATAYGSGFLSVS